LALGKLAKKEKFEFLDKVEFTVFQELPSESKLKAVLNEKRPQATDLVKLE
jgi:hypothetical protein